MIELECAFASFQREGFMEVLERMEDEKLIQNKQSYY